MKAACGPVGLINGSTPSAWICTPGQLQENYMGRSVIRASMDFLVWQCLRSAPRPYNFNSSSLGMHG
jgi:hypothetical protein